ANSSPTGCPTPSSPATHPAPACPRHFSPLPRPPPPPPLFPYTTLFRSRSRRSAAASRRATRRQADGSPRSRLAHRRRAPRPRPRSEEHTSELQSPDHLVCRLLLEKKKTRRKRHTRRADTSDRHEPIAPH